MMLVTNKVLQSKDHVIQIAKLYFPRWRIEEYFRCKKQVFQFENFRVRKLTAINTLNFFISLWMAFLALLSMASESHALKVSILQTANAIKQNVYFTDYRLIACILAHAKEGLRFWFKSKRPAYRQLCFNFIT